MAENICSPVPTRLMRMPAMLCPLRQTCPEELFFLQGLIVQALNIDNMSQELLAMTRSVEAAAQAVKMEVSHLATEVNERGADERQEIVLLLYKRVPMFSYYIQAVPEIKRIIFKRRQLRMTFRLFNSQNLQTAVPGHIQYTIKAFTCASPFHEVSSTGTGTPIIVGETTVEAENQSSFEFFNICFTAGSSKYPHGYFNLVIMSTNSEMIEPLVVEKVNVRLKYRKVMIMKNRRKKLCLQQQAQVYSLAAN